jgi:hypothetical protein
MSEVSQLLHRLECNKQEYIKISSGARKFAILHDLPTTVLKYRDVFNQILQTFINK